MGERVERTTKCPRCEVEHLLWKEGEEFPHGCAISRASRAEDDAPIPICSRCGQREAMSAAAANPDDPGAWRIGAGVPPPEDWPLSIDELLEEDRLLYTYMRSADSELRTIGPDDAEGLLGDDE